MIPYIHYEPAHLCAPMALNATVRLLFGLKAHISLHIEHFDIKATFLHEAFGSDKSIYVKEMSRSDRTYRYGCTVGLLKGNMYGGKSADNYFLNCLISKVKKHGYSPTDVEPCLYYKRIDADFIVIYVCIDEFLVIITKYALIDTLFDEISSK